MAVSALLSLSTEHRYDESFNSPIYVLASRAIALQNGTKYEVKLRQLKNTSLSRRLEAGDGGRWIPTNENVNNENGMLAFTAVWRFCAIFWNGNATFYYIFVCLSLPLVSALFFSSLPLALFVLVSVYLCSCSNDIVDVSCLHALD